MIEINPAIVEHIRMELANAAKTDDAQALLKTVLKSFSNEPMNIVSAVLINALGNVLVTWETDTENKAALATVVAQILLDAIDTSRMSGKLH